MTNSGRKGEVPANCSENGRDSDQKDGVAASRAKRKFNETERKYRKMKSVFAYEYYYYYYFE